MASGIIWNISLLNKSNTRLKVDDCCDTFPLHFLVNLYTVHTLEKIEADLKEGGSRITAETREGGGDGRGWSWVQICSWLGERRSGVLPHGRVMMINNHVHIRILKEMILARAHGTRL